MRLRLALPVRVSGVDANGVPFEEDCTTVDLTPNGLRVEGLKRPFRRGAMIAIRYGSKVVPVRVMWNQDTKGESPGHVGLQVVGSWENFWGRSVPRIPGDAFRGKGRKASSAPAEPAPAADPAAGPKLVSATSFLAAQPETQPRQQFSAFIPADGMLHRMMREPRLKLQLPVRLVGMDSAGRPFIENVITVNVSRFGAALKGVKAEIRKGEILILSHQDRKGRFRVVYQRETSDAAGSLVGLRALEPEQSVWALDFTKVKDECGPRERRTSKRYSCGGSVSVWHPSSGQYLRGALVDISLGGCYIEVMKPLPANSRVVVLLHLGETEVRGLAEVRAAHPGIGMGMMFCDLSQGDLATLETAIGKLGFGRPGGPGTGKAGGNELRELLKDPTTFQVSSPSNQDMRS